MLTEHVNEHGAGDWAGVSRMLDGRTGDQCRERWCRVLNPGIEHEGFCRKRVWKGELKHVADAELSLLKGNM